MVVLLTSYSDQGHETGGRAVGRSGGRKYRTRAERGVAERPKSILSICPPVHLTAGPSPVHLRTAKGAAHYDFQGSRVHGCEKPFELPRAPVLVEGPEYGPLVIESVP